MAPSATTTVTEAVIRPKVLDTTYVGAYKVLNPRVYSKEAEEGKTGLKAAKVRTLRRDCSIIC